MENNVLRIKVTVTPTWNSLTLIQVINRCLLLAFQRRKFVKIILISINEWKRKSVGFLFVCPVNKFMTLFSFFWYLRFSFFLFFTRSYLPSCHVPVFYPLIKGINLWPNTVICFITAFIFEKVWSTYFKWVIIPFFADGINWFLIFVARLIIFMKHWMRKLELTLWIWFFVRSYLVEVFAVTT